MFENGMNAADLGTVHWRKSTRSNSTGNCVELARLTGSQIGVRDSKHPSGPALIFTGDEIAAWITDLKTGRHDDLLTAS
jgi:Domain of unknown function (DUF397)